MAGIKANDFNREGFGMSVAGVIVDEEDVDSTIIFFGSQGTDPGAIAVDAQQLSLKLVKKTDGEISGFGLGTVLGISD